MAAHIEWQEEGAPDGRRAADALAADAQGESISAWLPHVDPTARDALNDWLTTRAAPVLRLDSREFEISWTQPSLSRAQIAVELAFGTHRLLVALDGFAALDPLLVGEPFALMPSGLRELVLQHMLAQILAAAPTAIAEAADLRSVQWDVRQWPDWKCVLGFSLRRRPEGTQSHGILAAETPAALAWLNEKLPIERASRSLRRRLDAPLNLVLGRSVLTLAQLRDLEADDVVWIETAQITRDGVAVGLFAAHAHQGWRCWARHASLRVVAATEDEASQFAQTRRDYVRPSARSAAAGAVKTTGDDTMNSELSALEIPVTFDLGDLGIRVQELESIQPGRIFDLPQDVANAIVNLRVSGKLIAQGALVIVGKRLGVRISTVQADVRSNEQWTP